MPKVKKIELSFVCDEDWNKMTPVQFGRHCAACQKTVINFSGMSDAQIIAFYAQKGNEKTCGQFRTGQLEHINKGLALPERKVKTSFFRPILASVILSTAVACAKDKRTLGAPQVHVDNRENDTIPKDTTASQLQSDTSTSIKKEKFEPRKITYVQSMKTTDTLIVEEAQVFEKVIISKQLDYPNEKDVQLRGVPQISYDEREYYEQMEQEEKGKVEIKPVKKKDTFLNRIFNRLKSIK